MADYSVIDTHENTLLVRYTNGLHWIFVKAHHVMVGDLKYGDHYFYKCRPMSVGEWDAYKGSFTSTRFVDNR